jgi:hypothetical protein
MLPASAQLTQAPVQAVLQQTPSAQNPEAQSPLQPQVAPIGRVPAAIPPSQLLGGLTTGASNETPPSPDGVVEMPPAPPCGPWPAFPPVPPFTEGALGSGSTVHASTDSVANATTSFLALIKLTPRDAQTRWPMSPAGFMGGPECIAVTYLTTSPIVLVLTRHTRSQQLGKTEQFDELSHVVAAMSVLGSLVPGRGGLAIRTA